MCEICGMEKSWNLIFESRIYAIQLIDKKWNTLED